MADERNSPVGENEGLAVAIPQVVKVTDEPHGLVEEVHQPLGVAVRQMPLSTSVG